MAIYQVVIDFNENKKDYVSANIYKNGRFYKSMDDIAKPWNFEDYTMDWKNGLFKYYTKLAKNFLPKNFIIVAM